MGWFRKKGIDVIDLGEMQRKGLLRGSGVEKDEESVVDLGAMGISSGSRRSGVEKDESGGASVLGFLDNLAGLGRGKSVGSVSSGEGSSYGSYSERLKAARKSRLAEFNNMKVKMEDLEYKIDRLIERLEKVEGSISFT